MAAIWALPFSLRRHLRFSLRRALKKERKDVKQLNEKGISSSIAGLAAEIAERDERDRTRATSPLLPADDAIVIDSTSLSIDEVVQQILTLWSDRS